MTVALTVLLGQCISNMQRNVSCKITVLKLFFFLFSWTKLYATFLCYCGARFFCRSERVSSNINTEKNKRENIHKCLTINMLFAGWEVRIVKICNRGLENAARGRGQHFQARCHSFSLYEPTLSRQITCIFFFAVVNWFNRLYKWVCFHNSCHSMGLRAVYLSLVSI